MEIIKKINMKRLLITLIALITAIAAEAQLNASQILELDSTGALTQEKLTQIYASAGLRDAELEEAAARSTKTSIS